MRTERKQDQKSRILDVLGVGVVNSFLLVVPCSLLLVICEILKLRSAVFQVAARTNSALESAPLLSDNAKHAIGVQKSWAAARDPEFGKSGPPGREAFS